MLFYYLFVIISLCSVLITKGIAGKHTINRAMIKPIDLNDWD